MDTTTNSIYKYHRKKEPIEVFNYIVLFLYSFLFIIMQTVLYKNQMDFIITSEYLLGLCLTGITLYRFAKLSKEGRLDWIKLRWATFFYFAVRICTLFLMGFEASTRKTGFFEGIYLLALSELTVDWKFLKKYIIPTLVGINLGLNILNFATQAFFGVNGRKPLYHIELYRTLKPYFYKYPNFWYHNPNYIGILTAFCILIMLVYVADRGGLKTRLGRMAFTAYLFFQSYCVYYSHSRASIMSLLLCLIIMVANTKLKLSGKKILLWVLGLMTAAVIGVFGFIIAHDSTGLVYNEGTESQYSEISPAEEKIIELSSSRYSIWKNSYYVMKDPKHLLFGSGNIEREHNNRDDYKKAEYAKLAGEDAPYSPRTYSHDHNGYVTMLTVTGLLGAIFFGITIYNRIKHSLVLSSGLWYILFCYAAFINQFEVITIVHKRAITYILIAILAISTYGKGQEEVKE